MPAGGRGAVFASSGAHRTPFYRCGNGRTFASVDKAEACRKCGSREYRQDADVLDTRFSSALCAFATRGWPDDTETQVSNWQRPSRSA